MALFMILVWDITAELLLHNSASTVIFGHIILFSWYFPQVCLLKGFENNLSLLSEKELLWGEFLLSPPAYVSSKWVHLILGLHL